LRANFGGIMSRITIDELRQITPGISLPDATLTLIIDVATDTVNSISTGCGAGLSDETLKNVELYLSAHIVSVSDPSVSVSEEQFENARMKYNTAVSGSGILGTPFGQLANFLSNGCLVEKGKRPTRIFSVGV
jgi:hypothetical protein